MPEAEVVNPPGGNEAAATPMLKIKIAEQIEYYFGDFNLMKDKFLKQEIIKDDGWVPLTTLLRFNRLAALTKDVDVILSAFKENPSELIEVDEDRKCVRRNPDRALPEQNDDWKSVVAQRTVYVKGFPTETASLDDILKFMQAFGKIDNVFRRNYFDKTTKTWKFKGSVYAAFPTREEAESFVSIKSVKYAGNELIRKLQLDYIEEKKTERLEQKKKSKQLKDELLKEQQEMKKKELRKLPTGALVLVTGLTNTINRHQLKDAAKALDWDVAFVEYNPGDPTAYIRLQAQDSAKQALSKLENNSFKVNDIVLQAECVEGEKETELLKKMEDDKNTIVMQHLMKSKFKGKKSKGKRFNKRDNAANDDKNEEDDDDDSPMSEDASDEKKEETAQDEKKETDKDEKKETTEGDGEGDNNGKKRKPEDDSEESAKKSKTDSA